MEEILSFKTIKNDVRILTNPTENERDNFSNKINEQITISENEVVRIQELLDETLNPKLQSINHINFDFNNPEQTFNQIANLTDNHRTSIATIEQAVVTVNDSIIEVADIKAAVDEITEGGEVTIGEIFEYISSLKAPMQAGDVFSSKNFIFTDPNDEAIQSFSVAEEEGLEDDGGSENLYEIENVEGTEEEIGLYV